jgi:hypothetical protein
MTIYNDSDKIYDNTQFPMINPIGAYVMTNSQALCFKYSVKFKNLRMGLCRFSLYTQFARDVNSIESWNYTDAFAF